MFTFALYIKYGRRCEEYNFKSLTPLGWAYYRLKYWHALKEHKSHYSLLIGKKVIYRSK